MNFDDLQNVWNSPHNSPTAPEQKRLLIELNQTLQNKRRNHLVWLVWTFLQLGLISVFVGWLIFATDKLTVSREWSVIVLLLIPWFGAGLYLKQFLRPALSNGGNSDIVNSLNAAKAANLAEQLRLKILGVMYLVFLPALALAMRQLHSVGKITPRETLSMALFLGAALTISACVVAFRYYFRLVPRKRHLDFILNQYN